MPRHEWSHKNRKSDASYIGEVLRIKRSEGRKSNKYLRFSISSFFGEKGIVIQEVIFDMH